MENSKMTFTGWFGFWIFMTVFFIGDTYLYSQGHETLFWKHKTVEEKEMQKAQIESLKDKQ